MQRVNLAVSLAIVLLIPLATNAQTYLFGRADFPAGVGPTAIAVGDLNSDGKPDLIVANFDDNTISVLLGQPDGGFAPKVDYATGSQPGAVAVGDFNGDGNLDVMVANENCVSNPSPCIPNGPGSISILLGNGDGTLQLHVDYTVGNLPTSLAVADFNGDKILDIAVNTNLEGTGISVLLGKGDGTFGQPVDYATTGAASVVAADVNGDGIIDLVTSLAVFLGNGNGTFQLKTDLPSGGAVAVADLNHDGKPDIVSGTSVYKGLGDGTFLFEGSVSVNGGALPTSVVLTDLNGDGNLDLVLATSYAAVLFGNGNFIFNSERDYLQIGLPQPPVPGAVAIGDFNGDGQIDLAITDIDLQTVAVLLGFPDGTFSGRVHYNIGDVGVTSVAVADLNHDNKLDVVAGESASPSYSVSIFLGNGDGTLQAPTSFPGPTLNNGGLTIADLNQDGSPDLATVGTDCNIGPGCDVNYLGTLFGNGDGTFQPVQQYSVIQGTGFSTIASGDFNGDGFPDLVVNGVNSASVFINKGDGTFQPHVDYLLPTAVGALATTDLNLNGNTDIVAIAGSGVSVLLGNGDGTFQTHVDYPFPAQGGFPSLLISDLNGDGKPDVAVYTTLQNGSRAVAILLGNGDGTLQPYVTYPAGTFVGGASAFTSGDFNADGKLDLLAGSSILLGNGDGSFQAPRSVFLFDNGADSAAAGDLNGDGVPDLVGSDLLFSNQGGVSVLLSAPFKAVYPTFLNFGSWGVGITSTPLTVAVSNAAGVPFAINSIVSSPNYPETNNCPSTLAPAASCTIAVTFTPNSTGQDPGTLTLTDGTRSSPQTFALSGSGVNGPFLQVSPVSLDFGVVGVGSKSNPASVTLTNTGNAAVAFGGFAVTGANSSEFTLSGITCGSSIVVGASCGVKITFAPTAGGTQTASLMVMNNAPGNPQIIPLEGTGREFDVTLKPTSLTFSSQVINTPSTAQPVTLSNSGNAALSISSISASGDFGETNNCGASLSAGASCTISVKFTPTESGTRTGALTITDSAASSPQTVSLSGQGVVSGLNLRIAPGNSSSATVTAGQTANYLLSIGGAGVSGTATLSCTGAPTRATCTLPANVNVSASTASNFTVSVKTTGSSAKLAPFDLRMIWMWAMGLIGVIVVPVGARRATLRRTLPLVLLVWLCGCGGGGSGSSGSGGTPTGSYTLTVQATMGSTVQSMQLTLKVQ
jgi:hypothetical protein